jgi:RsiW-degrading membrane proteinase PrsW (M82 family)
MMKNKLILGLLLSIMLITIVSASIPTLGIFKQNSCIELKNTCASCSYINFTRVSYPNSTRALDNVQATKDGSNFNYTFCSTSALGTYIVDGIGDVDGTDTVFAYDFEVTPSGISLNESDSNLMLAILVVTMLLTFFFAGLSYKFLEKDNLFGFGLFFLLLSFVFVAYTLYLGVSISSDFLSAGISGPQTKVFNTVLYGLVGMSFLGMLLLTIKTLKEIKERKSLQKNTDGYTQ